MAPVFEVTFTLNRPALQRFLSRAEGGIVVELEKDQPLLRVKGIPAKTPEEALDQAHDVANRVLDWIAFEFGLPLIVLDAPRAVEGLDVSGRRKRWLFDSDSLSLTDEVVQITVRKADGTIEIRCPVDETIEVLPHKSDCVRFYRGGLVAESRQSWFEAMREYFRAIECVATAMEGDWDGMRTLVNVLRKHCSDPKRCTQLREVALHCPGFPSENPDLAVAVAEYLYHGHRCELAHARAKAGKRHKKPFDLEDEWMVREALPLARFVAVELIKMYRDRRSSTPLEKGE